MSTNKVEVAFCSYLMCFRMPIALLALALWTTTVSHNNHGIKPQMGFLIAQNNFKWANFLFSFAYAQCWSQSEHQQKRTNAFFYLKIPELIW